MQCKFLISCDQCNVLVEHNTKCMRCHRILKRDSKKDNYLIYMPLEPQIRQIFKKHFHVITDYLSREHVNGVISDVDDGNLYRKNRDEKPHAKIIALTLNADGEILRSSRGSLWPVPLYMNCLPPDIRYMPENILVTTMYYGMKKPCMNILLYPLAAGIDYLSKNLISIYKDHEFWNFLPLLLLCACDLPARTDIQNSKGLNAEYGCPFCYHVGVPVQNKSGRTTIRYVS